MQGSTTESNFNPLGFTKEILLSTAFVTAICYYIGWSELSAYYLSFGISPSFIDKPVSEIIGTAWQELVFGMLLISFCIIANYFISKLPIENIKTFSVDSYIPVFVFVLLFCVVLLAITLYLRQSVSIKNILAVLVIYGFILFLYIATILGYRIQAAIKNVKVNKKKSYTFFSLLYPNVFVYVVLILVSLVLMISYLGIWKGSGIAKNDMRIQGENMLSISLYSDKPLPISGETYDATRSVYSYQGLKLVDVNSKYIFAIKFISATNFETYIIPKTESLVMESAY